MRTTDTAKILEKLEAIENLLRSDEQPMTVSQAAEYLNVSKGYLYKATSSRLIPYYQPGGKLVYFKRTDLNNFAYKQRIMSEEELMEAAAKHTARRSMIRTPIRRARA